MRDDLFLLYAKNNDEFAQYCRGTMKLADSKRDELFAKWRGCKHLFVVIEETRHIGAFHSSDCETVPARVECVHCGLTNKLIKIEDVVNKSPDGRFCEHYDYNYGVVIRNHSYATEEFVRQFGWDNEGLDKQRFLSKEKFPSWHPGVLFQIARELYFSKQNFSIHNLPDASNNKCVNDEDAIFAIMKELHENETTLEQLKISSPVHASALIERYKRRHKLYINSTK